MSELIWEKEIAICRKRSVPTASPVPADKG